MRSAITTCAASVLLALGALPGLAAPAGAADRSYTTSFDWSDPTVGFAGWTFREFEGPAEIAARRYSGTTGPSSFGRGLTITPTGDNGRVYPNGVNGRFVYNGPGASPRTQVTTSKAIYQRVTARVRQRQALRFGLFGGQPLAPLDLITAAQDVPSPANPNGTVTRSDPAATSTMSTAWMFQLPCDAPPDQPACATVDPAAGSVNHVGGTELSLVDHEAPTVTASGPAYEQRGRWLANTPASVTLAAADPGSGVRSYTLKSTGPGGSRTILNRTVACDLKHTDTTAGSQQCPTNPAATTRDRAAIGALPTGTTTFTATSRDLAGQASRLLRWNIKIDRQAPKTPNAPELTRLNGTFVRADEKLTIPVTSIDAHSGVLDITAEIRNSAGSRTVRVNNACKPVSSQCPRIGRGDVVLNLTDEPTGTTNVILRAKDLAGNVAVSRTVRLRVDKIPPNVVRLDSPNGGGVAATVSWREPPDEGGSQIDRYEARLATVGVDDDDIVSALRRSRFRSIGNKRTLKLLAASAGRRTVVDIRAVDKAGNRGPSSTPSGGLKRISKLSGPAAVACDLFTYQDSFPGDTKPGRTQEGGARVRSFLETQTQLRVAMVPLCSGTGFDRIERLEFRAVIKDITQRPAWEVAETPNQTGGVRRFNDMSRQTVIWRKGQIPQLVRSKGDIYERAVRVFTGLCNAAAGGKQDYGVDGQLRFILKGARAQEIRKTTENTNARLRCPTLEQRHEREASAWKLLAEFSAEDLRDNKYRSPSTQLRRSLGPQPFTPRPKGRRTKSAWAAHHIVPVGATDPADMAGGPESGYDGLRSLLFRCRVHPNADRNGIYLRGFGLKMRVDGNANPAYERLASANPRERDRRGNRLIDLAKRTYHGDTFAGGYFGKLRSIFGATPGADSNCSGSFGGRVSSALAEAFRRQRDGNIGVEKPDS